MLLSPAQTTLTSTIPYSNFSVVIPATTTTLLLPKSLFLGSPCQPTNALHRFLAARGRNLNLTFSTATIKASLLESPVLWAGRLCIFYALLKAGLAGSQANPLVSGQLYFLFICFYLSSFSLWRVSFSFFNTLIFVTYYCWSKVLTFFMD